MFSSCGCGLGPTFLPRNKTKIVGLCYRGVETSSLMFNFDWLMGRSVICLDQVSSAEGIAAAVCCDPAGRAHSAALDQARAAGGCCGGSVRAHVPSSVALRLRSRPSQVRTRRQRKKYRCCNGEGWVVVGRGYVCVVPVSVYLVGLGLSLYCGGCKYIEY